MNSDPEGVNGIPQDLRQRAIDRLRSAYEDIYYLSRLPLSSLNKRRNVSNEYHSITEYTRELFARASAIGTFAVELGLISPNDQRDAMYEFCDNHPEHAPPGWRRGEQRAAFRDQGDPASKASP